jgi:LPXTG-motif cell wall-anchored protein
MSAWGNDCILASIDPDAVNPQATYNHVAYTRHDGAIWWTDAMWISGVSSSSNSGVSPEAPQPSLASTGINAASTIALTVGAVLALAAGAGILILRRRA